MTHPFPFLGSISQYWDVIYTEYKRLTVVHGQPPFTFMFPPQATIKEYIPKNGDEIIFSFWNREHTRELLSVEAALLPDEDREQVQTIVHPQGNSFEEPVKSAMATWKEIKSALKKAGRQSISLKRHRRKKKRGMHGSTLIALNRLREIHAEASKSKDIILPRKEAAKQAGIVINTWRNNDQELWDHWENKSYKNQNMQ